MSVYDLDLDVKPLKITASLVLFEPAHVKNVLIAQANNEGSSSLRIHAVSPERLQTRELEEASDNESHL